jgi:protein-tyrosine sulfotransferase
LCEDLNLNDAHFPYDQIDTLPVKGSSALTPDGKMTWKPMEKPKSFNPIGRWAAWTDQQKGIFKRICGETLIGAGYAENQDW